MRLILARHGETESTRERRALGRRDVPLNDTGRLQARALARCREAVPLAAVYSSPLGRALDTARAIAEAHDLPVEVDDGLAEMDVGEMDGHSLEHLWERHADLLRRWLGPGAAARRMPGGESLQEVQDRAWDALRHLAGRPPGRIRRA